MSMAKANKVIEGECKGTSIKRTSKGLKVDNVFKGKYLTPKDVAKYQVVEQQVNPKMHLFAKKDIVHTLVIDFIDGKRCMVTLDDNLYKVFMMDNVK